MIIKPSGDDIVRYLRADNLYRYLQIADKEKFPEHIRKLIDDSGKKLSELVSPCVIIREFKDFTASNDGILIDNHEIKSGVLAKISLNAESVFVFILTNGDKIEKECRKYYEDGEYFLSQIADGYGSVYAEATLDYIMNRIEDEINPAGFSLSAPYSPGYCDINISQQSVIFDLMKEENDCVTLSESFQMYPEKSISGLFFRMKKEYAMKFRKYFIFCSECKNRFCKHYRG